MAREYGKFFTSTWGDPDFRAIGRAAQHLYMQLISQPDLSMAGVITIAPVRWAQQSGSTEADVMDALATLTESRFAYVDQETQELLVRSYVRRDEGWKSPTTMKAIASAMSAVLSPGLKAALAEEVRRIDTSALSEKISEKTGRSTKEVVMGYIDAFLGSVIPHAIPHAIPHRMGYPMGINEDLHTTETATATEPAPATAPAPAPAPAPHGASENSAAPDVTREEVHNVKDEPRGGAADIRAVIIAREYTERVKLCDRNKVSAVVLGAMNAAYEERDIRRGLRALVKESRPVTPDTLRIAIEGKAPGADPKKPRTVGREGW